MADATARAMVWAETRGLGSHGLSRLPQYIAHLGNRRAVDPAVPQIVREKDGAVLVDAGSGLAFAACALAVREATARPGQWRCVRGHDQQPSFRRGGLASRPGR